MVSGNSEEIPQNMVSSNHYQYVYVYTDILENQYVGETKAPLLRAVSNQDGNYIYLNVPKFHSLPISRSKLGLLKYI